MGGTPWHAHHITERYSLLTIIALGEGVVGTVASLSAVVSAQGWSFDAVFVAVAGIGLTFGMWWTYFVVPQADLLHAHRERSFFFGYFHIVTFGAIVATGAGLHAAAYYIEHHSKLGSVETVLAVALPVGAYIVSVYVLYAWLVRTVDAFHMLLLALTGVVLAAAVWLADAGISMANCLLVVTLAPMVTVVGYETLGHRHAADGHCEESRGRRRVAGLAASCSGKPTNGAVRGCAPGAAGQESGTRARDAGFGGCQHACDGGAPRMPKTSKSGAAKKSELPSTLRKSPAKAQRTFAKAHDSAAEAVRRR